MTTIAPQDPHSQSRIMRRTTKHKPGWTPSHWFIGRPLSTADAPHQTIGKVVGLAVFSSDAMSSVAYGPQEMLLILAVAGTQAMGLAFPLAIGIVGLLVILTLSYEQTIHAYPSGGGAYIVSRDNLGELPALIAGAALLMDYVLTVSVSISSGVAQVVSAYPALFEYRALLAVVLVLFIMLINLRGVKESGVTFAIPTYFFLAMMFFTAGYGLFRFFSGSLGVVADPPHFEVDVLKPISLFLILRAFSNGTTSLTGVEAISNGITAFKEPRSHNAGATLVWMSGILATLLLGITFLSVHIQAVPSEAETVISQLARTVYGGRNLVYMATIIGTTLILVMAANTAFADFPRLGALVAGDGFLPRQLTFKGSRLVYSYGIVTLASIASVLILLFNASVSALIPLYAIGVFLSFTPARKLQGAGAAKVGSVFVYILVACVGLNMNIGAILDSPVYFLIGGVWMLVHVILMFTVARLIRAPSFFLGVGSMANIGGAASAPVAAAAFHPSLAPIGVLLAVLGYIVGTAAGWATGLMMAQIGGG